MSEQDLAEAVADILDTLDEVKKVLISLNEKIIGINTRLKGLERWGQFRRQGINGLYPISKPAANGDD